MDWSGGHCSGQSGGGAGRAEKGYAHCEISCLACGSTNASFALALSRRCAADVRGMYLFPKQRDHGKPMSNNAILKALERMGYKGKMTGHGFRAMAMSTIKERLGYRHELLTVSWRTLRRPRWRAHTITRNSWMTCKVMMQQWADYLDTVSSGKVIAANFGRVA
jgi:hypothetical protein